MKLLDLFCGAGGAAMGYHQAGFDEIVGVDIEPQPDYPFEFWQYDVTLLTAKNQYLKGFDMIHASPPCQAYSRISPARDQYPDLIEPTRRLLESIGKPYVIENVEGAPIVGYLKLCGSMFGMQIQRHRYFEISFPAMSMSCNHKAWELGRPHTVTGHADGTIDPARKHSLGFRDLNHAKELMGMPWVNDLRGVTEAIPPAYTKFIGEQFIAQQEAA